MISSEQLAILDLNLQAVLEQVRDAKIALENTPPLDTEETPQLCADFDAGEGSIDFPAGWLFQSALMRADLLADWIHDLTESYDKTCTESFPRRILKTRTLDESYLCDEDVEIIKAFDPAIRAQLRPLLRDLISVQSRLATLDNTKYASLWAEAFDEWTSARQIAADGSELIVPIPGVADEQPAV